MTPDSPRLHRRAFVPISGDLQPMAACEGAAVYVVRPKPRAHPSVWHGIAVHRFLELLPRLGKAGALHKIRRFKGAYNVCQKLERYMLPLFGQQEVEIIWAPREGVAERAPYRAADPERHFYARVDAIWNAPDGQVCFADFKTGSRAYNPATEPQFQLIAVALWVLCGRPPEGVHAEAISLTLATPKHTGFLFTAKHLQALEQEFAQVHDEMNSVRAAVQAGKEPKLRIGDHCLTCRAKTVCPKGQKILALEASLRKKS